MARGARVPGIAIAVVRDGAVIDLTTVGVRAAADGARSTPHHLLGGSFNAFVIGSRAAQAAVVVFTNSDAGMSIMPDLIAAWMPGEHPASKWLGYPRYVP